MVDPFLIQPVLYDWYNKGHVMCYSVCGMVHIKHPGWLESLSCGLKHLADGNCIPVVAPG